MPKSKASSARLRPEGRCILELVLALHVCIWPLSSVVLAQQLGSNRSTNGHAVDIAATQMTPNRHSFFLDRHA